MGRLILTHYWNVIWALSVFQGLVERVRRSQICAEVLSRFSLSLTHTSFYLSIFQREELEWLPGREKEAAVKMNSIPSMDRHIQQTNDRLLCIKQVRRKEPQVTPRPSVCLSVCLFIVLMSPTASLMAICSFPLAWLISGCWIWLESEPCCPPRLFSKYPLSAGYCFCVHKHRCTT